MAIEPMNRPAANIFYQDVSGSGDYRFFQLAWVVDDLMATLSRWVDVFGVGPFNILPRRMTRMLYRGVETEIELQVAVTQSGPVQLEFIQQFSDVDSVYREIYPMGRAGLHHLCTVTDQYDDTFRSYVGKGYAQIAEIDMGGMRVSYYDTHADFGFVTEVVENSADFMSHLRRHAHTCRNWDGETDPLRFLCRGGYRVPGDDRIRPMPV